MLKCNKIGCDSMRNIIFLDVDGVLNSLPYSKMAEENNLPELDENSIKILGYIVKKYDALIVLSSTWRDIKDDENEDCKKMWNLLTSMLEVEKIYISDVTEKMGNNRPLEIYTWIRKNANKDDKFLILDDDFSIEDYKKYNLDVYLIKTYFFCNKYDEGGLQQKHKKVADEIFHKQKKSY